MENKKKKKQKFISRIWTKELDRDSYFDDAEKGRVYGITDWIESREDVSLGSIKNPNPDLLEIKFVCHEVQSDEDEMIFKNSRGFFGRFM